VLIQAFRRMEAAVDAADEAMVGRLIATAPETFRVNADRGVVQVMSCGENVLAQYALPAETVAALTARMNRLHAEQEDD
jgi:hypothetical protein